MNIFTRIKNKINYYLIDRMNEVEFKQFEIENKNSIVIDTPEEPSLVIHSNIIEDDSSNEELNLITEPEPAPIETGQTQPEPAPVETPVAKRPGRPKSDPAKKPTAKKSPAKKIAPKN